MTVSGVGMRGRTLLGLVGFLLVLGLVWFGQGEGAPPTLPDNSHSTTVLGSEIAFGDLPPEARRTIDLIEAEGPFPYRQDGTTFGNRERLLPVHPSGYYREFTVPTPGARDRGARRIVLGGSGETYYTEDHYRSFSRVDLSARK